MEADAIISTIEIAWKIGEKVVSVCENWRNANEEIDERINQVELCWHSVKELITFIERISPLLEPDRRRVLQNTIAIADRKLDNAVVELQSLLKDPKNDHTKREGFLGFGKKVKREKYALVKEGLDEVLQEMTDWQKRLEPNFYMLMTLTEPLIDEKLREARQKAADDADTKTINSPPATARERTIGLMSPKSPLTLSADIRGAVHGTGSPKSVILAYTAMDREPIPYSCACIARRADRTFIVDPLARAASADFAAFTTDVRHLVKKLATADPYTFGLLSCKGAMPVRDDGGVARGYELVLRSPEGLTNPRSLRQVLLQGSSSSSSSSSATADAPRLSLSRRLAIARQLARSIGYVHTFHFVHKGVSPESIIVMDGDALHPHFTFLVGFGGFRGAAGSTALVGDAAWEKNLYRHPERQGENPQDTYRMQHDVYSLGVCLLEIGLWESLVSYEEIGGAMVPQKGGPAHECFLAWAEGRDAGDETLMAFQLKDYLVKLAEAKLPQCMGDIYKDVVVACLTCLDTDEDEDMAIDVGEERALVGVQYVEQIVGSLAEIRL